MEVEGRKARQRVADTVDILSARILVQEHQAYPEALRIVCEGNYSLEGRRLTVNRKEC